MCPSGSCAAAPSSAESRSTFGQSVLDLWAAKSEREFPDGDVVLCFSQEECGGKAPVLGWAARPVDARGDGVTKHRCLGVYVCPEVEAGLCQFRERPRVPRGGRTKYATGGAKAAPEARQDCPKHGLPLALVECSCSWRKALVPDGGWRVEHSGRHQHAVPTPIKAPDPCQRRLERLVQENPEVMPCKTDFGHGSRPPAPDIHPLFADRGTLRHNIRQAKKESTSHFSGVSMAGGGGKKSEDSLFELVREVDDHGLKALMPGCIGLDTEGSLVASSSLGDSKSAAHITFCSPAMKEKIKGASTSFQTDTIEGFVQPVAYLGNIYLTVTPNWDLLMQCQVALMLSTTFGKSARDYRPHFDCLFEHCAGATAGEFVSEFVGNTSDYSNALKNGFLAGMKSEVERRPGGAGFVFSSAELAELYRLCTVHYRRSVERVSNISAVVPPDRKKEFITLAMGLVSFALTFEGLLESCQDLVTRFPLTKNWLAWYLQKERVELCFPAAASLDNAKLERVQKIKPDTNGQEGLGGFIQQLTGHQKLPLRALAEHVVNLCINADRRANLADAGMSLSHGSVGKKRPPEARERGSEKKRGYRPPDKSADLLRKGRGTRKVLFPGTTAMAQAKEPSPAFHLVGQMSNAGNTCFMSSLVQTLSASPLFFQLATAESCCALMSEKCPHPFSSLQRSLLQLEECRRGGEVWRPPAALVDSLSKPPCRDAGFVLGRQQCPSDYITCVLQDLVSATLDASALAGRRGLRSCCPTAVRATSAEARREGRCSLQLG